MKRKVKKLDLVDLILLAKSGNETALAELVAREEKNIRTTLHTLKATSSDVADISQDVLLKLSKNITKLKNPITFKSWLRQITVNQFYDSLRKKQRTVQALNQADGENKTQEIIDYSTSPHNVILKGELNKIIRQSMNKLAPKYRSAIEMRELKGLSYEEIATATKSSIGTVKSRISRAREKLQEDLKPYIGDEK